MTPSPDTAARQWSASHSNTDKWEKLACSKEVSAPSRREEASFMMVVWADYKVLPDVTGQDDGR
ncbi:hypothetical protein P3T76_005457 [Phytophthora citrophthora]|uniref:Uncharacterized protein n=1 Tax=Phytophthora citrophthora TaxID=4793 RepID=A0AAD9GQL0_9STRA|nr:hypothetical protein P3T76_005457 [Phytophthora citrophthora]